MNGGEGSPHADEHSVSQSIGAPTRWSKSWFAWHFNRFVRIHFPNNGIYIGIFAAVYWWVTVLIDVHLNANWWVFTNSSFSALGDPSPQYTSAAGPALYWIYNDVVMIPTGIMVIVFAAAMVVASKNKVQSTGSSFFMVSGIFLILIGIYHGGPPTPAGYHDFCSAAFFYFALISILIWSVGVIWERRFLLGVGMLLLAIVTVALLFIPGTKHIIETSVATTEAYGILAIDAWLVLMMIHQKFKMK